MIDGVECSSQVEQAQAEIWVKGHSRSFKLVTFDRFATVSYSDFIVGLTMFLCGEENITILFSRFDRIPERDGRTDGQTES